MLFRHSSEMFTVFNEQMRGGKGTVTVRHLLKPDEMLGKGRLFAELTIPPGASIGLHEHQGDAEAFYVLQGTGRYQNDDQFFDVSAGDMTLVDDQHCHAIENTGTEPLKLIGLILYTKARE